MLPFTPTVVPMLSSNPPWTELACAYLESSDFVSHVQLANLDGPENRSIVRETLEEIQVNTLEEIRNIATEARELRSVRNIGGVSDNTLFETTQAVRTCVAELTEGITTTAKKAPWGFHEHRLDLTHRLVVIAIICEVLADLDNIGGYFNYQLEPKHRIAPPEQSAQRQARGGRNGTRLNTGVVQEDEKTRPEAPKPQRKRTRSNAQREESPLFVEQDDIVQNVDDDTPKRPYDRFGAFSNIIEDGVAEDGHAISDELFHKRTRSTSSDESCINLHELGRLSKKARTGRGDLQEVVEGAGTASSQSVQDTNQDVHARLPATQALTPFHPRGRRLRSRSMSSFFQAEPARDYEALNVDFDFMAKTCEKLGRTLEERVEKFRRRELNVCQGDCFEQLEEADHRNWEKSQENDSLKASVAELQSTIKERDQKVTKLEDLVAELQSAAEEREEENIQLKALIEDLEQQTNKGKSRRSGR